MLVFVTSPCITPAVKLLYVVPATCQSTCPIYWPSQYQGRGSG